MVSFWLRQRIFFTSPADTRSVSFHLSQFEPTTLPTPHLTIGGELNKLAANLGFGRDFAGLHWRSDVIEGLKLGETVALNILDSEKRISNKKFAGFTLTRFDGTPVTI